MSMTNDVESNSTAIVEAKSIEKIDDSHEIEPTTEELTTLEHISDYIPLAVWLIVICELCERFAYYGLSGPFQNYIQHPAPGPNSTQPGALGRGQQIATALTTFFNSSLISRRSRVPF
ncbi:unnamed protein product [Rotaria sp. Silwood1]|nr:unnamed protein product [Rotaria sp. Silwood1]CAF0996245.1 unnamed protein product [Rotaria sp. Silwood1]CAF3384607.1 unnamed protein product [Rotaria sp. Silwood1]CAF4551170.1 unnamed protein product [Rotaria sp. Silwood1]CAF4624101.1 unnamed protein product [Rotaria sp. Silwood1]